MKLDLIKAEEQKQQQIIESKRARDALEKYKKDIVSSKIVGDVSSNNII